MPNWLVPMQTTLPGLEQATWPFEQLPPPVEPEGAGAADGAAEGAPEGAADGGAEGAADGAAEGTADGAADGATDGAAEGPAEEAAEEPPGGSDGTAPEGSALTVDMVVSVAMPLGEPLPLG